MGSPLRERKEGEARFLARVIPAEARVVGLLYPSGEAARTAAAAAGIASAVGVRRPHTLLTAVETGPGTLDDRVGGGEGDGLAAALEAGGAVTRIAIRGERWPYVYLPAGRTPPEPAELFENETFREFVARVRDRDGTLLVHAPVCVPEAHLAEILDGYVSLGPLSEAPGGLPEFGRVVIAALDPGDGGSSVPVTAERPVPAGQAPAESAPSRSSREESVPVRSPEDAPEEPVSPGHEEEEEEPGELPSGVAPDPVPPPPASGSPRAGRWSRHRTRSRPPGVRIAAAVVLLLALGFGWWTLARETLEPVVGTGGTGADVATGDRSSSREEAPSSRAPGEPGPTPLPGPAASEDRRAEAATPAPSATGTARRALLDAAPALPYSVLIASYARSTDATEAARRLGRAHSDRLFFVAPTPIRGAVWHRVFAGALADRGDARRLMEDLVRAGHKDGANDWDVRPAGLAFLLEVAERREEAAQLIRRAEAAGIPAYVLAAGGAADSAFGVYFGAYESEEAAVAGRGLLERVGWRGELITRRGEPR